MDATRGDRTDKLIDSYLSRIADNIVALLMVNGVSKKRFLSFIDDSYSRVQIPPDVIAEDDSLPPGFKDFFGTLIAIWRGSSDYVDPTMGDPIPIPITGDSPSFQSLYDQTLTRYPNMSDVISSDRLLDLMLKDGCVTTNNGNLSLIRSHFYAGSNRSMRGPSFLSYLKDLTDTLRWNVTETEPSQRLFQRQCNVPDFPLRFIPQLNNKIEQRGMDLLENIDNVIEGFAADPSIASDEPRVNVGVAVVFFTDDDPDIH